MKLSRKEFMRYSVGFENSQLQKIILKLYQHKITEGSNISAQISSIFWNILEFLIIYLNIKSFKLGLGIFQYEK